MAVFTWLARYNIRRRHSALGHISSVEFERRSINSDSLNLAAQFADVHMAGRSPLRCSTIRITVMLENPHCGPHIAIGANSFDSLDRPLILNLR